MRIIERTNSNRTFITYLSDDDSDINSIIK
jgi:hypothetical protein